MEYILSILGGLWLLILTIWLFKFQTAICKENEDDYEDLQGQIYENKNLAERLDSTRAKQIAKLSAETPRAKINDQNEAVLIFEGKEILNYDLKKKSK